MCGISGYLGPARDFAPPPERLRAMAGAVAHRGPDGDGFYEHEGVGLAHRRLSIIDLATGGQPMLSDDEQVAVMQNGEIYNYVELRAELEALGHRFRTDSDTETILRAYDQWGVDCQSHLNGMWGFALWDGRKEQLLLSRDRLGEKPLHYTVHDGVLYFASEIKSLFAAGVPREIDPQWTEIYCRLGYIPAPHSFFRNIHKLPAGSFLLATRDGFHVRKYWDLPTGDEKDFLTDETKVQDRFAELFRDSVRIRMRADVPFGAFLSGGLDSGCVVATMAGQTSHPVRTFTIGFDQKEFDERDLARAVAEKFGTQHVEKTVAPGMFDEALERVVTHYDEPFGDASAIPTGYVSSLAAQEVKMVLTGDGGDEVLSGYTMYQGEKFAQQWSRLPRPVRTAVPAALKAGGKVLRGKPRFKVNRAVKVSESSNLPFEHRLARKLSRSDPALVAALLGPSADRVTLEDFLEERLRACPWQDPFYRLMYYHLKVSLPDDMLVKVDRMSMAYSLETRTPFLDHRLVEWMCGVDKRVKMNGYERKTVLRNTVARELPDALLNAPKKGFAVPLGHWFRGDDFVRRTEELARTNHSGIDTDALGDVVARNRSGQDDLGNLLWLLLVLERTCAP
ncbi:MAG: asparagine synthase (glutamine-hydrolyzing) [Gemmatimonadetes bacterium]|nr:asparagine synthase (glutamine-hydrolyzing) [Gemmatimonadota bacterium]